MARRRFIVVWLGFSLLYVVLAALGPGGVRGSGSWPQTNQHLLQVKAWLGKDISIPGADGSTERIVEVSPRLDVTPYFRDWVVNDPRERVLLTNLACGVVAEDEDQPLRPVRYVPADTLAAQLQMERLECHVGVPLGPAFLLLPLYMIFGGALATQWVGGVLGGLAVALMDLLLGWIHSVVHGSFDQERKSRSRLLVLAGIGTLWIWLVPQGEVWMFAQTAATTALTLALVLAWRRKWLWAGVAFGLAITCRPPTLLAFPLLVAILCSRVSDASGIGSRRYPRLRALATAALVPLMIGGVHLGLNMARFSSPLEFGYRFQLTPPELRTRIDSHGSLSHAYLPENIRYNFLQPPVVVKDPNTGALRFPYLKSDPYGMGVFFVTPAYLMILLSWRRQWGAPRLLLATWVSLGLVTLPALLFFNTGWVQWGGRYLLDAWPLWLVLTALGMHSIHRKVGVGLIVLSVMSNLWAALLLTGGWWP